jgi:hypothetical protein
VKRLFAVLAMWCMAAAAHADGGRLLMRQAAGPFVVSLFATPETLGVGQADLSAMVEERGSVLLDPEVTVTLTPEDGGAPVVAHLSHAHATNRLLQDAVVELPHAGRWRAVVRVRAAGHEADAVTELTVASYSARRGTIWTFLLLPVGAVALFGWVQMLKRRRLPAPA